MSNSNYHGLIVKASTPPAMTLVLNEGYLNVPDLNSMLFVPAVASISVASPAAGQSYLALLEICLNGNVYQPWNIAVPYAIGAQVSYLGLDYVATAASAGVLPTNGSYWTPSFTTGELIVKYGASVAIAEAASPVLGSNVSAFNILANTAVTLTGGAANILAVNEAGLSPSAGPATLTNATIATAHYNDATAIAGMSEANTLNAYLTSLAAGGAGIVVTPSVATTLPTVLNPALDDINVYTFATNVTNTSTSLTINGSADTVVIIKVAGSVTLTDFNVVLAGGQLSGNVYWQVGASTSITNDDATSRTIPGTFVSYVSTTVVDSGAGSLALGRMISLTGAVSMTQSGAGVLTVPYPVGGGLPAQAASLLPPAYPSVDEGCVVLAFIGSPASPILPSTTALINNTGVAPTITQAVISNLVESAIYGGR